MSYFVSYNGKYIAERKSLKMALKFIESKGLKDDEDNLLYIVAPDGKYIQPDGEMMGTISSLKGKGKINIQRTEIVITPKK